MNNTPSFGIGEAFGFGWRAVQKHVGIFLLAGIISIVAGAIPIVGAIVGIILHIGIVTVGLKIVDQGSAKFDDFWANYHLFFTYLISSVLVGIFCAIGFVLLIIPGIIISIMLSFFGYCIVDKNAGPLSALTMSRDLTKGHRFHLFQFYLAGIGLNIVGALALGIGLIATIPTTMIAAAYVYRKLAGGTQAAPTSPHPTNPAPAQPTA